MAVYEYGAGKAYAHPQDAVDALFALTDTDLFTEDHYVRGFAGTYEPLEDTHQIVTLPAFETSQEFSLIFDIGSADESVIWSGLDNTQDKGIEANGVKYVKVEKIYFKEKFKLIYEPDVAFLGRQPKIRFTNIVCGVDGASTIESLANVKELIRLELVNCKGFFSGSVLYSSEFQDVPVLIIGIGNLFKTSLISESA